MSSGERGSELRGSRRELLIQFRTPLFAPAASGQADRLGYRRYRSLDAIPKATIRPAIRFAKFAHRKMRSSPALGKGALK